MIRVILPCSPLAVPAPCMPWPLPTNELDIPWVVVPRYPGMTSAAGLVVADIVHHIVQTSVSDLSQVTPQVLTQGFDALQQRADRALETDGVPAAQRRYERSLDIKYVGQGYTLNIPLPEEPIGPQTVPVLAERFHTRHEMSCGFRADEEPAEMINLRLRATGLLDKTSPQPRPRGARSPAAAHLGERQAWVDGQQAAQRYQIYARERLAPGNVIDGPAIVEQVDSTTVIPPGWLGRVDGYDNLILGTEEQADHGAR